MTTALERLKARLGENANFSVLPTPRTDKTDRTHAKVSPPDGDDQPQTTFDSFVSPYPRESKRITIPLPEGSKASNHELPSRVESDPATVAHERRLVEEDLRAEGTSLARELAKLRRELPVKPPAKPASQVEERWRKWAREYREIRPLPGCPSEPCRCGDRVYFRLSPRAPWRCRSCERVDTRMMKSARWWLVPAPRTTTTTKEPT
jgi:hypothetical protein